MAGTQIDLTGQKFGKLSVLHKGKNRVTASLKSLITWVCLCECGTMKEINAQALRNGSSRSCGCSARTRYEPAPQIDRLYKLKQYEARRRGNINFSLSKEEFIKLVLDNCYYCGEPPAQTYWFQRQGKQIAMKYSGIDRQDNSKGYISGNCVPCCTHCNQMKLAYTHDEFLAKIARIYKLHIQ